METELHGFSQVAVKKKLYSVPVLEQFLRVGGLPYADVVYEAERGDGARLQSEASLHPFRGGK